MTIRDLVPGGSWRKLKLQTRLQIERGPSPVRSGLIRAEEMVPYHVSCTLEIKQNQTVFSSKFNLVHSSGIPF